MRELLIENLVFLASAALGIAAVFLVLYGPCESMSTNDKAATTLFALSLPSIGAAINYYVGDIAR
jgi:hypothetical protein